MFSLPIKGGTKWREIAGPGFDQIWPFYATVNEKLYAHTPPGTPERAAFMPRAGV